MHRDDKETNIQEFVGAAHLRFVGVRNNLGVTDDRPERRTGRPRGQLPGTGSPAATAASWLREVQDRTPSVTQQQIAEEAGWARETIQPELAGRKFPRSCVVEAVVELCGLAPEEEPSWEDWVDELRKLQPRWAAGEEIVVPGAPWKLKSVASPEPEVGEGGIVLTSPARVQVRWKRPALLVAAILFVTTAAAVSIYCFSSSTESRPSEPQYERVSNRQGAPTFGDPRSQSGVTGSRVPAEAIVLVSCKVFAPTISSAVPDGYWYKISDPPWNGQYFAVANVFLNGDPPGGPYSHNTDYNVPDC